MTEDKMVGWHHCLNGHEFQQTLGDGEGQGSLACCSPWGSKESDTTEQPNNNQYEIKVTQEEEMRKWGKERHEEKIFDKFLKLMRDFKPPIQEIQQTPSRINTKKKI